MNKFLIFGMFLTLMACDDGKKFKGSPSYGAARRGADATKGQASTGMSPVHAENNTINQETTQPKPQEIITDVVQKVPSETITETTDCKKQQNILILDFKSGWWSGDGGDFVKNVIKSIQDDACKLTVKTEYHHLLAPNPQGQNGMVIEGEGANQGQFPQFPGFELAGANKFRDFGPEEFTQIWILSGSEQDSADLKVDSPMYQDIVAKVVKSKAALFIGGGYGSVDHANELGRVLLGKTLLAPGRPEGDILFLERAPKILSMTSQPVAGSPLFDGTGGPIVDQVEIERTAATSDYIALDEASYQLAAKCKMGNKAKNPGAEMPCIGLLKAGERRVIVDSGLQRLYSILDPNQKATERYLHNLVRYLSH